MYMFFENSDYGYYFEYYSDNENTSFVKIIEKVEYIHHIENLKKYIRKTGCTSLEEINISPTISEQELARKIFFKIFTVQFQTYSSEGWNNYKLNDKIETTSGKIGGKKFSYRPNAFIETTNKRAILQIKCPVSYIRTDPFPNLNDDFDKRKLDQILMYMIMERCAHAFYFEYYAHDTGKNLIEYININDYTEYLKKLIKYISEHNQEPRSVTRYLEEVKYNFPNRGDQELSDMEHGINMKNEAKLVFNLKMQLPPEWNDAHFQSGGPTYGLINELHFLYITFGRFSSRNNKTAVSLKKDFPQTTGRTTMPETQEDEPLLDQLLMCMLMENCEYGFYIENYTQTNNTAIFEISRSNEQIRIRNLMEYINMNRFEGITCVENYIYRMYNNPNENA
ncbi:uncharacterized protein LOC109596108 [Aethina tumida]|uniref:uncharacterized protein LOC109596108 n=1 Tax=Aethina tumida TaxID=116153 RepID=UPI002147BD6D|nr:uncharacterized protein LOC109596108 [Aethina tumida]